MRSALFNMRLTDSERAELDAVVSRHGFDSMAAALKWLVRAELERPRTQAPACALIGQLPARAVRA